MIACEVAATWMRWKHAYTTRALKTAVVLV